MQPLPVTFRILFVVVAMLAAPSPAAAHPAVGIVMDRIGNVFYSDLVHVWRITPQGHKSIVVRDVHTHNLVLDDADNLFGEDSEFLGGDRWRHRVWRRAADGRVTDVVPWTDGFWQEHGLVRDRHGTWFWPKCTERSCTVYQRTRDGRTAVVGRGARFNTRLGQMAPGPARSLYVVDGADLRLIDADGRLRTVAAGLGRNLMGLFLDPRGNLLVAAWGDRAVLRVTPAGRVTRVATSPAPWGPSGVTVAPDGALWLLETSTSNAVRVRRIGRDGRVTIH